MNSFLLVRYFPFHHIFSTLFSDNTIPFVFKKMYILAGFIEKPFFISVLKRLMTFYQNTVLKLTWILPQTLIYTSRIGEGLRSRALEIDLGPSSIINYLCNLEQITLCLLKTSLAIG